MANHLTSTVAKKALKNLATRVAVSDYGRMLRIEKTIVGREHYSDEQDFIWEAKQRLSDAAIPFRQVQCGVWQTPSRRAYFVKVAVTAFMAE